MPKQKLPGYWVDHPPDSFSLNQVVCFAILTTFSTSLSMSKNRLNGICAADILIHFKRVRSVSIGYTVKTIFRRAKSRISFFVIPKGIHGQGRRKQCLPTGCTNPYTPRSGRETTGSAPQSPPWNPWAPRAARLTMHHFWRVIQLKNNIKSIKVVFSFQESNSICFAS